MKTKNDYYEKLKDPRWQKKRLEIFKRDKFTCKKCGDTETTLHVHHLKYEYHKEPWEYDKGGLITLCNDCHVFIEVLKKAVSTKDILFDDIRVIKIKLREENNDKILMTKIISTGVVCMFLINIDGGYINSVHLDDKEIKTIIKILKNA